MAPPTNLLDAGEHHAQPAVKVENVSKCFRVWPGPGARIAHGLFGAPQDKSTASWALRDVSFEVKPGSAYGVVGRNGSGKSTLLKIVCGVMQPTTGFTETRGRVLGLLELGAGLNLDLTGRTNVHVSSALLGFPPDYARDRMRDIEAFADIGEFFDVPMKFYSSGMLVRVAFALYAFLEPDVLIIDEALSVGDYFFQQKCIAAINRLRDGGATMLFVSHSIGTVKTICDRAIALDGGQVIAEGNVDAVADLYLRREHGPTPAAPGDEAPAATRTAAAIVGNALSGMVLPPPDTWSVVAARFLDAKGHSASLFEMRAPAQIEAVIYGPPKTGLPRLQVDIVDRLDRVVSGQVFELEHATRVPLAGAEAVALHIDLPMEFEHGAYAARIAPLTEAGDLLGESCQTETVQVFHRGVYPEYYCIANLPARYGMRRS
ncbi:ABC transporter ATP-binding protein [Bosea massiliensis]|uniref:ABC transporter ATP-binding protein n=1 Tax=Bosea massiliensis TaxID=151419 RepID=A0ABW0P924_9HYPH